MNDSIPTIDWHTLLPLLLGGERGGREGRLPLLPGGSPLSIWIEDCPGETSGVDCSLLLPAVITP
jgi:hypothetical protein